MKNSKELRIAALVLSGVTTAILLLFAIGETVGGDWSGLGHLAQAAPIILLMWLGWKRPLWGGIFILVLSFIAAYSLADALRGPEWLAPFLIIIAPLLISGFLFLGAAALQRRIV
jgi:hypothetical protein